MSSASDKLAAKLAAAQASAAPASTAPPMERTLDTEFLRAAESVGLTESARQGNSTTAFATPFVLQDQVSKEAQETLRGDKRPPELWQLWMNAFNKDPHGQPSLVDEAKVSSTFAAATASMATPRVFRRTSSQASDESGSPSDADWVDVSAVSFPSAGGLSSVSTAKKIEQAVPLLVDSVKQLQEKAQGQADLLQRHLDLFDKEHDELDIRVGRVELLTGGRADDCASSIWDVLKLQQGTLRQQQEAMDQLSRELNKARASIISLESKSRDYDSAEFKDAAQDAALSLLTEGGFIQEIATCKQHLSAEAARGKSTSEGSVPSVAQLQRLIVAELTRMNVHGVGAQAKDDTIADLLAILAKMETRLEHVEEAVSKTQVLFGDESYASLAKVVDTCRDIKLGAKDMNYFMDSFALLQLAYQKTADPNAYIANESNSKKAGFMSGTQATIIASLNLCLPVLYGGTEKEQSAAGSNKYLLAGMPTWESWMGSTRLGDQVRQKASALRGYIKSSEMSPKAKAIARDMLDGAEHFLEQFFTFKLNFMSEMGESKEAWELLSGIIHQMWTDFHKVRAEAALVDYDKDEGGRAENIGRYLWSTMQSHHIAQGYLDKQFSNHPSVSSVMTIHLVEHRVSTTKFAEVMQKQEKDIQFAVKTANEAKKIAEKKNSSGSS